MYRLSKAWINLRNENTYLNFIIIIAPIMNFLSGIAFSLYAPSMPNIATEFNVSLVVIKNTITITMVGFALGSILFGVLMDFYGRKKILLPTMMLFIIVSFATPYCTTIWQLMLARFLQGVLTAAAAIGSRALIVDYFTQKRFVIAILYTTVAYGLGLVLGPFIGGYLQYEFNWHANFYAYGAIGILIELLLLLFINESLKPHEEHIPFKKMFNAYFVMLENKPFLAGITILGIVTIQQLIYPTIGVFLVQNQLHYTALVYGNTALMIGVSYLAGTLLNRFLLHKFRLKKLLDIGFLILALSTMAQFILSFMSDLSLWTLVLPIVCLNVGLGFIFGNVLGLCLQLFPKNAGMNSAVQSCFLMLASSIGIFVISYLSVTRLIDVTLIFFVVLLIQGVLYYGMFRKIVPSDI